ncbi:MAG: hypothetical protein H6683_04685 [Deltaproteobacteria bacterium]|nr:hypothetical protein [Deltaproteobacteria bacterium]
MYGRPDIPAVVVSKLPGFERVHGEIMLTGVDAQGYHRRFDDLAIVGPAIGERSLAWGEVRRLTKTGPRGLRLELKTGEILDDVRAGVQLKRVTLQSPEVYKTFDFDDVEAIEFLDN